MDRPAETNTPKLRLCVLASGSSGNCSVLTFGEGLTTRVCLLDAGLSPRRTRKLLADEGFRFDQVDHILVTHFDRDHFHLGWQAARLDHIRVHAHADHAFAARRAGITGKNLKLFEDPFTIWDEVEVGFARLAHDQMGVTAFRIETENASLGYATDLGRPAPELTRSLHGVGTLAIESNYCPQMQIDSPRPEFLKRRIMGGAGHLSNQESAEAVRTIRPNAHAVLLHLSRQCNTPDTALDAHRSHGYETIVSSQFASTDWINIAPRRAEAMPEPQPVQPSLFSAKAASS
ncbi:MAG: MBL fold metallo-hydrolase [Phycisphaerales bacterium]